VHSYSFAADSDTNQRFIRTTFYASIGLANGSDMSKFNLSYSTDFANGDEFDMNVNPVLDFAAKVHLIDNLRLCANYIYFTADFRHAFDDSEFTFNRSLNQSFDFTRHNVLVGLEYYPFFRQLRSYFGLGAGVAYSFVEWSELNNSSSVADPRKSGLVLNKSYINPVFSLYSGVELGFDDLWKDNFIAGICIEVKTVFSDSEFMPYEEFKYALNSPLASKDQTFSLFPTFIELSVGLIFNLKQKIR